MGNYCDVCGAFDAQIQELLKNYMPQLIKLVVAQEGSRQIQKKYKQLQGQADKVFDQKINQGINMAQQPLNTFQKYIKSTKQDLNSKLHGGISAVEKLKGEPIQKTLKADIVKDKLQNCVNSAKKQAKEKKVDLQKKMKDIKNDAITQLKKTKPSIPIYDDLPGFIQDKVYDRVKQQGKDKIEKDKEQVISQFTSKLDVKQLGNHLTNLKEIDNARGILNDKTKEINNIADGLKNIGGISIPDVPKLF